MKTAFSFSLPAALARPRKKVFVSYNHADTSAAYQIKGLLEKHGAQVAIDRETNRPGYDIQEYLERHINQADMVVLVVSRHSLLSAWVAMEVLQAFHNKKTRQGIVLAGCYVDDCFLEEGFVMGAVAELDARLKDIEGQIAERAASGIDTPDLNARKTRLYGLRNQLAEVVGYLCNTFTLDIREGCLAGNFPKLLESIGLAPRRCRWKGWPWRRWVGGAAAALGLAAVWAAAYQTDPLPPQGYAALSARHGLVVSIDLPPKKFPAPKAWVDGQPATLGEGPGGVGKTLSLPRGDREHTVWFVQGDTCAFRLNPAHFPGDTARIQPACR